jgi:hypothetical protein
MSITFKSNVTAKQLINFLASEYQVGSNIPVHLFSVVNATFPSFNKMTGICDDNCCIYLEQPKQFKCYGSSRPGNIMRALAQCRANLKIVD